jgi:phosphoglycolate phosphatase-like HAD superfamily hydrolase
MAAKALPSQEVLRQLLDYNADTGALTWRQRDLCWFSDGSQTRQHNAAIWNGKNAGREAFITALPNGHLYGGIKGQKYLAHRVIWKMVYGFDPEGVDHIDGNPSNNRINNLREASQIVNGRNAKTRKNNTSGAMGVRWEASRNKWIARIHDNYRSRHIGCFDTFEEALAARKQAERELGFHENHGRAA